MEENAQDENIAAEEDQEKSEESSEIDSLDSQAEARHLAREALKLLEVEVDVGPPTPELTDEELHQLVTYVKKMTTLYDLQEDDWTPDCEREIRTFFMDVTRNALSIYFEDETLKCLLGFPLNPVNDLMYFIREQWEIFTPDNFHDNITFGTVDDSIEGSLLKVVENIYAPIFFNITSWPESIFHTIYRMNRKKFLHNRPGTREL